MDIVKIMLLAVIQILASPWALPRNNAFAHQILDIFLFRLPCRQIMGRSSALRIFGKARPNVFCLCSAL